MCQCLFSPEYSSVSFRVDLLVVSFSSILGTNVLIPFAYLVWLKIGRSSYGRQRTTPKRYLVLSFCHMRTMVKLQFQLWHLSLPEPFFPFLCLKQFYFLDWQGVFSLLRVNFFLKRWDLSFIVLMSW